MCAAENMVSVVTAPLGCTYASNSTNILKPEFDARNEKGQNVYIGFKATVDVRNQSASCLQLWFHIGMLYCHCFLTLYHMPLGRLRQGRGLKLKVAHQLLVCADVYNCLKPVSSVDSIDWLMLISGPYSLLAWGPSDMCRILH
jgi:hypothetical protein